MHTAGPYHGSVFIYHINDEHIFLDGCPAQTSADLLKIQHLRQRWARHNEDSEFRIVPAFRDHIAGTEETYLMLLELLHNLLRMFCISTVILRRDTGGVQQACHLFGMRLVDTEDNSLTFSGISLREIVLQHIYDQFISGSDTHTLLQIRIHIIFSVKTDMAQINIRLDPVDIRPRHNSLLHCILQRKLCCIISEDFFQSLFIRTLIRRCQSYKEFRRIVLDHPL